LSKYAPKLCAHCTVVGYILDRDSVYKKINNKEEVVCLAVFCRTADYCLDKSVSDEFVNYLKRLNSDVVIRTSLCLTKLMWRIICLPH